jgi:hypothetical protein
MRNLKAPVGPLRSDKAAAGSSRSVSELAVKVITAIEGGATSQREILFAVHQVRRRPTIRMQDQLGDALAVLFNTHCIVSIGEFDQRKYFPLRASYPSELERAARIDFAA